VARKYRNGQKIKIIEVKDQHGHLKYPQTEQYLNQTGVIARGFDYRMDRNERIEPYPSYVVRLDSGIETTVPMPQDALVALDD